LPLNTVFQLAVIAATAAGPLVGSAAVAALVVGFAVDEWLPPALPQAARIKHPATAANARRGPSQCTLPMAAVCRTKRPECYRFRRDTSSSTTCACPEPPPLVEVPVASSPSAVAPGNP
jgi:hypothetical protein